MPVLDVCLFLCLFVFVCLFVVVVQRGESAKYQVLLGQMEYVLSSRRHLMKSNATHVSKLKVIINYNNYNNHNNYNNLIIMISIGNHMGLSAIWKKIAWQEASNCSR